MPFLYEGRQHKRSGRESLDCAYALKELSEMGVSNFITFDAHDPRVQNATPPGRASIILHRRTSSSVLCSVTRRI